MFFEKKSCLQILDITTKDFTTSGAAYAGEMLCSTNK
jgi:hypothetical protein